VAHDPVREFVEQLLRTGLTLIDLLSALLDDVPEDAFPGEEPAEALLDMLVGTLRPVADAAGPDTIRESTALLAAARDRTLGDLRAAAAG
jgi:hypothetical protein